MLGMGMHKIWREIVGEFLSNDLSIEDFIKDFRKPGGLNSRLASWEPREMSLRWYRTFLNLAFLTSTDETKHILQLMKGKISLGKPIQGIGLFQEQLVEYNLDTILAVEELSFVKRNLPNNPRCVAEIGPGFGRTTQIFLELIKEIETYYIFDLPQTLEISKKYLASTLSEELFKKIFFSADFTDFEGLTFDLGIQINGLQEMSEEVITNLYFKFFDNCEFVYLKNPVAKYLPEHAGLDTKLSDVPLDVGRSRDIVDIWNLSTLKDQCISHVIAYKPLRHQLITWEQERLFPHFCNVLYSK